MAARIYSQFKERKLARAGPLAKPSAGSGGRVVVKQAFTSAGLPGKASNWYGKKGKVVKTYAHSQGLC